MEKLYNGARIQQMTLRHLPFIISLGSASCLLALLLAPPFAAAALALAGVVAGLALPGREATKPGLIGAIPALEAEGES